MKAIINPFTLIILPFLLSIFPVKAQQNIDIYGYVRNYTGILTRESNEFSIIQNTFNVNFEKKTGKAAFKVNPFIYQYSDREIEFGLREAYLDLYFNKFDLRLGRQQIIYGKAEGVFITDVVSPKDLREFLLPDFEEIRTGVTAAKLNYYIGNNSLEAVWVPVFSPTIMPADNSIWAPEIDFPVQPVYDYSTSEISPSLENSELFLRYSALGSKIDYELVGGTFFYDDPAMHINRKVDPATMQLTGLTVRPEYHRVSMAGGSFSLPAGPLVVRAEGGYYAGRYFQTENPSVTEATLEKDYLHYMGGIDYTLAGIKLSAQLIQEFITDYEEGLRNDEFETTMTFLAKKDFFREKLWLELFSYIGLNNSDALIRPKISYSFTDGFDIQLGANIFTGTEGRFGQYNENDMIYTKLKFSF